MTTDSDVGGVPGAGIALLEGAEPQSWHGDRNGVLVLHGFTANPSSVRILADAAAEAGWSVELPLLPGHGTTIDDLIPTRFADWLDAAEAALVRLQQRCDRVVVMGLSMGGSLTLSLASTHPELAGLVCINPAVQAPPETIAAVQTMVDAGVKWTVGIGSDVADPNSFENAYEETPLEPLLSLLIAADSVEFGPEDLKQPLLLVTSRQDHVVSPEDSVYLAANYGGTVDHLWLSRSFHVATRDYDRHLVTATAIAFASDRFAEASG
ncbi:MAG: alpha/beta fold hydrolase [Microthrixaceae bacterium]|nr:alpha/beta fold hydrolase [Microthrixaceae bacterium]